MRLLRGSEVDLRAHTHTHSLTLYAHTHTHKPTLSLSLYPSPHRHTPHTGTALWKEHVDSVDDHRPVLSVHTHTHTAPGVSHAAMVERKLTGDQQLRSRTSLPPPLLLLLLLLLSIVPFPRQAGRQAGKRPVRTTDERCSRRLDGEGEGERTNRCGEEALREREGLRGLRESPPVLARICLPQVGPMDSLQQRWSRTAAAAAQWENKTVAIHYTIDDTLSYSPVPIPTRASSHDISPRHDRKSSRDIQYVHGESIRPRRA
jgi:hypothetical protein